MDDADAFRSESRDRWNRQAGAWEAHAPDLARANMPVAEWMIDALNPQPGHRILELAAGVGEVGFLAAELVEPGGELISSDFSPGMLSAAQRRAEQLGLSNVRFKQIDAESIDLPAASLDGVLCRWGFMLMADPGAALQEVRRVLRPGRPLALAAWAPASANPWASLVGRELVGRGLMEAPEPGAPGQFAWAEEGVIAGQLEAAGFDEILVEALDFVNAWPSFEEWIGTMTELASRVGDAFRAAPDPAGLHAALREAAAPYTADDGSIELPARTWVARAEA